MRSAFDFRLFFCMLSSIHMIFSSNVNFVISSVLLPQQLTGITATAFMSSQANILTFQQSVAQTVTGVQPTNVIVLSAIDVPDQRRQLLAHPDGVMASSSILVSFTISLSTGKYSSASTASAVISFELESGVNSGNFTAALAQNAKVNGATALKSVNAISVTSNLHPTAAPTQLMPETGPGFSRGAFAGWIVFAFSVLSVLVYLVSHFVFRRALIFDHLPVNFSEKHLIKPMHGVLSVSKFPDGVSAAVVFESNIDAEVVMAQSWYYLNMKLKVRWARPFALDAFLRHCCGYTSLFNDFSDASSTNNSDPVPFLGPQDLYHDPQLNAESSSKLGIDMSSPIFHPEPEDGFSANVMGFSSPMRPHQSFPGSGGVGASDHMRGSPATPSADPSRGFFQSPRPVSHAAAPSHFFPRGDEGSAATSSAGTGRGRQGVAPQQHPDFMGINLAAASPQSGSQSYAPERAVGGGRGGGSRQPTSNPHVDRHELLRVEEDDDGDRAQL